MFGGDYPTLDGTGVRDYIHVMDLAGAHVHAFENGATNSGARAINVGTGRGLSVPELVRALDQSSSRQVPFEIVERRVGDVAELWAGPARTEKLLGWDAQLDLTEMCNDTWRWQFRNPTGFGSEGSSGQSEGVS